MSFRLKDVLVIGCFAIATTWLFEYFFFPKKNIEEQEQRPGQAFIASNKPLDIRPLNTEVDFIDTHVAHQMQVEEEVVETDSARLTFTNQGAALDRLEFKRATTGRTMFLTTIYPPAETNREDRCFLVAFEEQSPFNYVKIDRVDDQDYTKLTYQAPIANGHITKTFIVHKNSYQLDLKMAITVDDQNQTCRPRIFFPAPILPDIRKDDVVSGIVMNDRGSLEIMPYNKIDVQRGWFSPSLFGTQDKYFIHALVKDVRHFVQRAYYYRTNASLLYAIVEGPLQAGSMEWELSFYFGPKESDAVSRVDPRLEQALEHAGIFAPLSRWLLALLVFLFSYLGNYGVAIIILTIAIRLLLWPFALKGTRAMKNGKNEEMQRKLKYIELKYKDDPERLSRERAAILRAHGSMMVSGCLPLLLQLPVMYALNRALASSIVLYGAPFLWIPDLSARDPYMILPALIMVAMLLQALYVDKQQRPILIITAFLLGAFSMSWSAGLVLYLALSTLIGVLQSFLQQKIRWL